MGNITLQKQVSQDSVHEKYEKKKKRLYVGGKGAETKLWFVHKN